MGNGKGKKSGGKERNLKTQLSFQTYTDNKESKSPVCLLPDNVEQFW